MRAFADLAKALNRSTVYLSGLQSRFELPTFDGAGYSEAYLAFLQTVVYLRTLSITEETLRNLWHIEKNLLALIHADTTGSPTWFLDSCGATTHPKCRLLLTHHDMRVEIHGMMNSVALMIDGYNHDAREIYAIPEVRAFYKHLWEVWPYWLYFCNLDTENLMMMVMCCLESLDALKVKGQNQVKVSISPLEVVQFISGGFVPMRGI